MFHVRKSRRRDARDYLVPFDTRSAESLPHLLADFVRRLGREVSIGIQRLLDAGVPHAMLNALQRDARLHHPGAARVTERVDVELAPLVVRVDQIVRVRFELAAERLLHFLVGMLLRRQQIITQHADPCVGFGKRQQGQGRVKAYRVVESQTRLQVARDRLDCRFAVFRVVTAECQRSAHGGEAADRVPPEGLEPSTL